MSSSQPDPVWISSLLPIRLCSTTVHGFGRGASDLGIPTANLDVTSTTLQISTLAERQNQEQQQQQGRSNHQLTLDELPCGIYWGFCRIGERSTAIQGGGSGSDEENGSSNANGVVFQSAISIGYSPTYGNKSKTIEPHLIAPAHDPRRHASQTGETILQDFYNEPVRLSVVGYLRPELPFEGLEKLVQAIKQDIVNTERLAQDLSNPVVQAEQAWVASNQEV